MNKKEWLTCLLLWISFANSALSAANMAENSFPDSVFLFAYSTEQDHGRSGLHFAWSLDQENWYRIGNAYGYLKSDYGEWGAQKRMEAPYLFQDSQGLWHCLWSVNNQDDAFAHAASEDLIQWGRQKYPILGTGKNCMRLSAVSQKDSIAIYWLSYSDKDSLYYVCSTADFNTFTSPQQTSALQPADNRRNLLMDGKHYSGTVHHVNWKLIDGLFKHHQIETYKQTLHNEKTAEDPVRFADLQPVNATISIESSKKKNISNLLIGAFFEDINYAADGGLYAELVQNRDFEYALTDKKGKDPNWNSYKAWRSTGDGLDFSIDSTRPLHSNNKHFAKLSITKTGNALRNEGFDGIVLRAGERYNWSLYVRSLDGHKGKLMIRLVDQEGRSCGEMTSKSYSQDWVKYEGTITATKDVDEAELEVIPLNTGLLAVDFISLFPEKTFRGRKNGLRADLAQTIADIKPRFVRFPGGCVAHGDGIKNIYRWKNSIGPLEARTPMRNLWGYHQTLGLGYYEYFLFCEDIGAEPLPVLAAGVPCQNSADGGAGQQCGIPQHEMEQYIQDILDLIEWANGDPLTTKWGKVRAESGHPEPFNLKYIGIGNEDLITDVFEERFTQIFQAIQREHPEITVIGTVGPFCEGTDYVEGWKLADKLQIPMVDEHYYNPPGWYIHNQDFYDKYDRSKSKVYLGEYASHLPGRPNNLETALSEALYLTAIERNGDIVHMTSYAPLLAKEEHTQWNPDLIYFNNKEVKPTTGYYVQQLYGQNHGDVYYPQRIELSNENESVRKRFAVSVIENSESGEMIVKLVNLLPVPIKPTIRWEDGSLPPNTRATVSLLTGHPNDQQIRPTVYEAATPGELEKALPPYSFKVIKVRIAK